MAQSISQEAIGATGLPGATSASRHAGATTSGAPTTGTFAVGDFIVDQSGAMYVCTVAGTPGSWGIVGTPPTAQIAGKNAIINGDFGVWQRGTTFNGITNGLFSADRWHIANNNSGATVNITQQTFTPGTAPVAGYESAYYLQYAQTVAGSGATYSQLVQNIEDVRKFAGQTITVSFWAKSASGTINVSPVWGQYFGTGGSSSVENGFNPGTISVTTTWTRYTAQLTVPSIAGKTIGANNNCAYFYLGLPLNSTFTLSVWGVQIEAGQTATEFTTASGTVQGELALCQRYYYQITGSAASQNPIGIASLLSSTNAECDVQYPVTMRTSPTMSYSAAADITVTWSAGTSATSALNQDLYSPNSSLVRIITSGLTAGQTGYFRVEAASTKYIAFNAEL